MSAIDTIRAALFGNPPVSGFPPSREGVFAAFTELYQEIAAQIAVVGLGGLIDVTYATRAELDLDLNWAADSVGLVWGDATNANVDFYIKVGASGAGSWTLTTTLHDMFAALAQSYVDAAAASASDASASAALVSEGLGPLYDLIARDDAEVFTRGSHLVSFPDIDAGLKGWRSPFKHDGSVFNVAEFTIYASAENTRVLCKILDSSLAELTRGYAVVGTTPTTIRPVFNKFERSLAADEIAYFSYEPADAGGVLSYPAGGAYDVSDADPNTYREYYLNGSDVWTLATPIGSYRIQFRLMDYTNKIQAGAFNLLWQLVTTGLITTYSLPGYSGYDSTYSIDGLGTSMSAQAVDIDFNVVAVYGGCSGAGVMRGYLVDPATPTSYTPTADATLLFEHAVNWTNEVLLRTELLDQIYTVPAGMRLDVLWVAVAAVDVVIARWSTNPDGNLPRIRLCVTGVGDEAGIWGNEWAQGSAVFCTIPPTLKISQDGSVIDQRVPSFTIPSKVYGAVGTQLPIQHDAIVSVHSDGLRGLNGYSCAITGPKGKNEQRLFRMNSSAGDIGEHSMLATLWDTAGNEVATRSFTLKIVAATPFGAAKNILLIADSLGANGTSPLRTKAKFVALGATVPTFVGTVRSQSFTADSIVGLVSGTEYTNSGQTYDVRGIDGLTVIIGGGNEVALASSGVLTRVGSTGGPATINFTNATSVLHIGIGGKTFQWFTTDGGIFYRFTVSGVTTVEVGAVYSVGAVNYTITAKNISGGAGTITTTGASEPAASGTLTKVSGTGDASIAYSAEAVVPGNPLWNVATSELDVANFRTVNGIGAVIDGVMIDLGTNGKLDSDLLTAAEIDEETDAAATIAAAFLADNATGKIIFGLTPLGGNTNDGYATNYDALYSREIFEANVFALREAMLTAFDDDAYSAHVKVGSAGLVIDRYYGYDRIRGPVSAYTPYFTVATYAGQIADLTPNSGTMFRCTDASVYIVKVGASGFGGYRQARTEDGIAETHNNALHPGTLGYKSRGDQHFVELLALLS